MRSTLEYYFRIQESHYENIRQKNTRNKISEANEKIMSLPIIDRQIKSAEKPVEYKRILTPNFIKKNRKEWL